MDNFDNMTEDEIHDLLRNHGIEVVYRPRAIINSHCGEGAREISIHEALDELRRYKFRSECFAALRGW